MLIYIYVLIPNPLPSAVALRIELLWAVSSRHLPHSIACTLFRAHHSSQAAEAADARADAAARAAVSAFVVVIVCAKVAKQAAFCAALSGTRAVGLYTILYLYL